MHTENIEYRIGGQRFVGHLAVDRGRPRGRPGVLLCHEGPGLSENARVRANRLAALGYVAFALDYIGEGRTIPRDELKARLGPLMADPLRTRALGRAGLDILKAQPEVDASRMAAIGFCFGGTMALELARGGEDLRAVLGFHAGLATSRPQDAGSIRASVLVCIGAEDPMIPPDQRAAFEAEMRAGGVADWRLYLYGAAAHGFTNRSAGLAGIAGLEYHALTDERTWRIMLDFFEERLGTVPA
jgi:dienelactone hydrolase